MEDVECLAESHNSSQAWITQTFDCNKCGKVFKSKYSLRDHEVERHGKKARFSCFVCEKGFYSRHVMLSHVKVHDEPKTFKEQHLPKHLLTELSSKSKIIFEGFEISSSCVCDHCGKIFQHEKSKRRHEITHADEKKHERNMLNIENNPTPSDLKQIKELPQANKNSGEFGQNNLKCILDCKKTFSTKEDLDQHMIVGDHNGQFFFSCSKCPRKFGSTKEMRVHEASTHDQSQKDKNLNTIPQEFQFTCSKCSETFESTIEMRKHMTEFHILDVDLRQQTKRKPTPQLVEDDTEEKVNSLEHLSSRGAQSETKSTGTKKTKTEETKGDSDIDLKCKECGSYLPSSASLKIHEQIHEQQNIHVCSANDECTARFPSKKRLNVHMLQKHGLESKPGVRTRLTCHVCNKTWNTASELKGHMARHSDEKSFVCVECGKCLKTERSLQTHSLLHTGTKDIKCDECEQVFYTRSAMINHKMRNHDADKSEKLCPTCGEQCCSKASLKRHMVRHSGQRQHKCGTCGKEFFDRQVRRIHERIHEEACRYKCTFCEKQFRQSHQLVAHTKRHKGVNN